MAIGQAGYSYTLTLGVGRKRVMVSNNVEASALKRMCSDRISLNSESSSLESLPLDILIEVLCGVDHEDLKQLFHVSKTIREATLIAKELDFEYSTPKRKIFALHIPEDGNGFQDIDVPNAPLRKSKSRLNGKKLDDISMTLFTFVDDEQ